MIQGVQEEASALGVPVLITRDFTERPEVIEAGLGYLVGCNQNEIVSLATKLLEEREERKSRLVLVMDRLPHGSSRFCGAS